MILIITNVTDGVFSTTALMEKIELETKLEAVELLNYSIWSIWIIDWIALNRIELNWIGLEMILTKQDFAGCPLYLGISRAEKKMQKCRLPSFMPSKMSITEYNAEYKIRAPMPRNRGQLLKSLFFQEGLCNLFLGICAQMFYLGAFLYSTIGI